MADRKNTAFTNEHFAAFCLKMVGQPYWYGTCGYKATSSLLTRKASQYPSHYTSSRTSRYKQDIQNKAVVCDCIGGAKAYAWTDGGQAMLDAIGTDGYVPNKYGSNGCPDHGANGMFTWAKSKGCSWGTINTLPEIVGLALNTDGHVGYYVGNGYAVEWRGFNYGCVRTKVSERAWKYWYKLPFIDYNDTAAVADAPAIETPLGSRLLKKGSVGTDVKVLQELLIQTGYSLPSGADGAFGAETEKAVLAFQKSKGLEVDGKYGDKTHSALMDAAADDDEGKQEEPAVDDKPVNETEPETNARQVVIVSDGSKVNIRAGNDVGYTRITAVAPGTTFEYIATATNGWNAIVVGAQVGWVSGQYSKVL
jgi:peptidoglycan hydrolase-like protein with peptidoglycan-binding domain